MSVSLAIYIPLFGHNLALTQRFLWKVENQGSIYNSGKFTSVQSVALRLHFETAGH